MKRLLVICDGMADEEIPALKASPLEFAKTPAMDFLAAKGKTGLIATIPEDAYPGSENGILTILGYGYDELPGGRGALEASGLDIELLNGEAAGRYNLLEKANFDYLKNSLPQLRFHPFTKSGGLVTGPAKILEEASRHSPIQESLKIWSVSTPALFRPLREIHLKKDEDRGVSSPIIICYVPLLRGIAKATGVDFKIPSGATGRDDTDYKSIAYQMINALDRHDFVVVHIEACDYLSHQLDSYGKVKAIERIDRHIITPALERAMKDKNIDIIVLPDHYSLSTQGRHNALPVPALLFNKNIEPDRSRVFSEKEAANGSLRNIDDLYG